MIEDGAVFLAGLYEPPLRRLAALAALPQDARSHPRARAAAWGEALQEWLAGYSAEVLRRATRRHLAGLFNFCRKPPWEVRPAGVSQWLQVGQAEKTDRTRLLMLSHVSQCYRFACTRTWTSPSGRRLRLCRRDPTQGVPRPRQLRHLRALALNEAELQRLWAAFDLDTPFGRRDFALFTLIFETGLRLQEALDLRLVDLFPPEPEAVGFTRPGWEAAGRVVRAYLEGEGRLAGMDPAGYLFTPLQDMAGNLARADPQGWQRKRLGYGIRLAFKRYVAWAGLDAGRITPQTLRHSGAMRLLQAGASPQEAAAFLGRKYNQDTRRLLRRLHTQVKDPQAGRSRLQAEEGSGVAEQTGRDLPRPYRRRRPGGQPGNRNHMKNGLYSARYRVERYCFTLDRFQGVDDAALAWIIAELIEKVVELLDMPEGSWRVELMKARKLSTMFYRIGKLKAIRIMKLREENE